MQWVEYDTWDPKALLQLKESTTNSIASLESLVSTRQYRPFLELHAMDSAIIDVPWNGFSQAVSIGAMAEAYEINIAPHNYYSHLADLHSINLCAILPNVRIMEIDIDDVPWKTRAGHHAADDQGRPDRNPDRARLGYRRERGGGARPSLAGAVRQPRRLDWRSLLRPGRSPRLAVALPWPASSRPGARRWRGRRPGTSSSSPSGCCPGSSTSSASPARSS